MAAAARQRGYLTTALDETMPLGSAPSQATAIIVSIPFHSNGAGEGEGGGAEVAPYP